MASEEKNLDNAVTLEEALYVVKQLSPVEKARLIGRLASDLERVLIARGYPTKKDDRPVD